MLLMKLELLELAIWASWKYTSWNLSFLTFSKMLTMILKLFELASRPFKKCHKWNLKFPILQVELFKNYFPWTLSKLTSQTFEKMLFTKLELFELFKNILNETWAFWTCESSFLKILFLKLEHLSNEKFFIKIREKYSFFVNWGKKS